MARPLTLPGAGALIAATVAASASAQDFDNVSIEAAKVSQNVYMLTGRGGNMGLSVGEDGAFLIDDQFAPLTEKILAAIATLTDEPVRFVVNTHWHGDHTGGNENLGDAGAIVVAHENVRERMSTEQFSEAFNRTTPPAPAGALPVITFTDTITFHWNGDVLDVVHLEPAHTDGDSIIHFRKANVVHMGDTFFNGMYPYIDISAGGTITGMIAAAEHVLAGTDASTRIIPGHGDLSDVGDLRRYRDMLVAVRDRVQPLIDEGKTRDEIVAARPTRPFDEEWGGGFIKPDQFVTLVYEGLVRSRE